jgi:hypothetical protein
LPKEKLDAMAQLLEERSKILQKRIERAAKFQSEAKKYFISHYQYLSIM